MITAFNRLADPDVYWTLSLMKANYNNQDISFKHNTVIAVFNISTVKS